MLEINEEGYFTDFIESLKAIKNEFSTGSIICTFPGTERVPEFIYIEDTLDNIRNISAIEGRILEAILELQDDGLVDEDFCCEVSCCEMSSVSSELPGYLEV